MAQHLTPDDVRKVARLARLSLSDEAVEGYTAQLERVLEHIDRLSQLNVRDVEPLANPLEITNRTRPDVVQPSMPLTEVLANAPAVEQEFIAVPKVIDAENSSG